MRAGLAGAGAVVVVVVVVEGLRGGRRGGRDGGVAVFVGGGFGDAGKGE